VVSSSSGAIKPATVAAAGSSTTETLGARSRKTFPVVDMLNEHVALLEKIRDAARDEVDKILRALINRANKIGMRIPIGSLDPVRRSALAKAINLRDQDAVEPSISYENYVDILIYLTEPETENAEILAPVANAAFEYIAENYDPIFNSAPALISDLKGINETYNALYNNEIYEKTSSEEFIDYITRECVPCADRFKHLEEAYYDATHIKYTDLRKFLRLAVTGALSRLVNILQTKKVLVDFNDLQYLCAFLNQLINFVCIPDVKALMAIVNLYLEEVSKRELGQLGALSGLDSILSAALGASMDSVVQNIVSTLAKYFNVISSYAHCILRSIEAQTNKIPELDEAAKESILKFISYIYDGVESLKTSLISYIRQLEKSIYQRFDESLSLALKIEKHNKMNLVYSLLVQLYAVMKDRGDSFKSLKLDKLTLRRVAYEICRSAIAAANPWVEIIPLDPIGPAGPEDGGSTEGASGGNGEGQDGQGQEDGSGDGSGGDNGDGQGNDGGVVIKDPNLPDDFFDDDRLEDLFRSDLFKKYFDLYKTYETIENGKIDLSNLTTLLTDLKNISLESERLGSPKSFRLTFTSCLNASPTAFGEFSPADIAAWIDKLNNK
jgi:hypothetical protein